MSKNHISISTLGQLEAILEICNTNPPDKLSINSELLLFLLEDSNTFQMTVGHSKLNTLKELLEFLTQKNIQLAMSFPSVTRLATIERYKKILFIQENEWICYYLKQYFAGNLEILGMLLRIRDDFKNRKQKWCIEQIYADYSLYVFNSESHAFLEQFQLNGFCIPYEWSRHEMKACFKNISENKADSIECMIYGYIPLMESAGCVLKTTGNCICLKEEKQEKNKHLQTLYLLDRYKKQLPVVIHCERCENTIYNSVPFSLHKEIETLKKIGIKNFRFQFTIETKEEVFAILKGHFPESEFTKGHFAKGVE